MIERLVTIQNRAGIHARPAALIVQTAGKFKSKIFLVKSGDRVNAKSIMGILAMGAAFGTEINIQVEGEDEAEAANALEALINGKFEGD